MASARGSVMARTIASAVSSPTGRWIGSSGKPTSIAVRIAVAFPSGPVEPCVDEAGTGDARSPVVAELAADDLLEPGARVETDGDRALGRARQIDRAGPLARRRAIDHQRRARRGLRETLARGAGQAIARRLRADLAERVGEGSAIVVAARGVPRVEERALEDLALRGVLGT